MPRIALHPVLFQVDTVYETYFSFSFWRGIQISQASLTNVGVSPISSQFPELSRLSDIGGHFPNTLVSEIGPEKDTHADPSIKLFPFEEPEERQSGGKSGKDTRTIHFQVEHQSENGTGETPNSQNEMDSVTMANTVWNANMAKIPVTSPQMSQTYPA